MRCCKLLHPDSRTFDSFLRGIRVLGKKLTAMSVNVDKLTDEWNQHCLEYIKEEWYQSDDGKSLRVDYYYWSEIESIKDGMGHTEYSTILSVVKTALFLARGNAEVERGFSDSGKTVALDRIRFSEASTYNLQIATDELKVFGSLPHDVPVTPLFIKLGQSAYRNYRLHVEEERKKEPEKRRQEKQVEDEKKQT